MGVLHLISFVTLVMLFMYSETKKYRGVVVFFVISVLKYNCIVFVFNGQVIPCIDLLGCVHDKKRECGFNPKTREVRWFLDRCDVLEFNCEYKTICIYSCMIIMAAAHGPPKERDNEDVAMGRKVKMGAKWCSMAKVCNHDRVPVCGLSHAGDIMGFRDLCDMFDYNCIRRRNYKQTSCPDDRSLLAVSRRPTTSYFDE